MAPVRVLILRAAGINCDEETAHAWSLAGAEPAAVHVNQLLADPRLLDRFAVLTVPGGFSYGDDIASGRILANQIAARLAEPLARFVERGGLILGICNGFQVLVKARLLPGGDLNGRVTITHNESGRYEDRWVWLEPACEHCVFVRPHKRLWLPVAHGEGRVLTDGPQTLAALGRRHVALRYCDADGRRGPFPLNPNGSEDDIAALTDATGRVFGLMPHPERAVDRLLLPNAGRDDEQVATGLEPFRCAVEHLRQC